MPLSPFNPPEDQLDQVLETLADPDHSLRSAAELLGTTVAALSLFLLRPDISERLSIHNQAAAVKARLNACAALPDTATALRHAVNEYTSEALNAPYQLSNPRAVELRRRSRETMRKAASLLLRLATFDPTKPTRPSTPRRRHQSPLYDLRPSPSHPLTSSPSLHLDIPNLHPTSPSSSQISNLNSQIPPAHAPSPPADPAPHNPPATQECAVSTQPAPNSPPSPPAERPPTHPAPRRIPLPQLHPHPATAPRHTILAAGP